MNKSTLFSCLLLAMLTASGLFAQTFNISLKAVLEGPYNGTEMDTWLNSGNHLPLQQPYSVAPWNYPGAENVVAIPNADVVDWVLVQIRETPGGASTAYQETAIATQACFMLKNGQIVSLDGVSPLQVNYAVNHKLYAVLYHRNHLSVMSGNELNLNGNLYEYDFSTGVDQVYGGVTAHKQVAPGIWGMASGDGNGDGQVNNIDKNEVWVLQAGFSGYLQGDFDMNGQVNNIDKIDHWIVNGGRSSQVVGGWICGKPIPDFEGNLYNTILIGAQCWMEENLNIGTMISGSTPQTGNGIIEKYCYADDVANCSVYGGLYQWGEMMQYSTGTQGICPDGWHLPDGNDWCTLEQYVDSTINCSSAGWRGIDGGGKLKETGTTHWASPNTGATNSSGFTGLPGGYRTLNGTFIGITGLGNWWSTDGASSVNAWYRGLGFNLATVFSANDDKSYGFSVRCVKDASVANLPPNPPSDPNPPDNATSQPVTIQLSWSCTDPENDPLTYDVFFGTVDPPALVLTGQSDTIYDPGTLDYDVQYFWKIVAHDDHGNNTEGPVWSFTTEAFVWACGETIIDTRDGQVYNTVEIGGQCWMAENLNIGTMINGSSNQTNNSTIEKYCYSDNTANCDVYGGLYQWDEAMQYVTTPGTQGICPDGWHFPADAEWMTLEEEVESTTGVNWNTTGWRGTDAGGNLKETGTSHWQSPNTGATNSSGFTALPGGRRFSSVSFNDLTTYAGFWSSSENGSDAWSRFLGHDRAQVFRYPDYKAQGFSVRCLRDETSFNQPPNTPDNPQPNDGAIDIGIDTTLSWSCTDPENDPLSYDVYFGTSDPPGLVNSGQSAATYDPGTLDYDVQYFWKIVAHDDNANSTEGAVWDFTTVANQPPFQPYNPLPPDNSVDQPLDAVLTWSCSDPENDPLTYDVYFGTMDPPALVVAGQSDTIYDPGLLNYAVQYFWKIVAHDDNANSTEGAVWDFTTVANQPPFQPFNPLPPDNSVDQPLDAVTAWSCGDPENDPLTYDVYFGAMDPPALVVAGQSDTIYDPGALDYGTQYFWKVVARDDHWNNTEGPVWSFATQSPSWVCGDTIVDPRDGQVYNTVLIDTQCWMEDNLNIGTMISGSTPQTGNGIIEKYCYADDVANCSVYGGLYQWGEMMQYSTGTQGICPDGWHLPDGNDWCTLEQYVDSTINCSSAGWRGIDGGGKLKETGTTHWASPNTGATNSSGFTGLPGGYRTLNGTFIGITGLGNWWSTDGASSVNAWYRGLGFNLATVFSANDDKSYGFSVRCVKDASVARLSPGPTLE